METAEFAKPSSISPKCFYARLSSVFKFFEKELSVKEEIETHLLNKFWCRKNIYLDQLFLISWPLLPIFHQNRSPSKDGLSVQSATYRSRCAFAVRLGAALQRSTCCSAGINL